MLALATTSEKLQIVLAGAVAANQLHVAVSYSDITSAAYTRGVQRSLSNNTTDVDILNAPAASTIRDIDSVNVYNGDSAAATVTVKYDVGGTETIIGKWTLAPGDTLHYTHGSGWQCVESAARLKTSQSGGGGGGGGSNYEHDQSVASTTWTVNHNLGIIPAIMITDISGNQIFSDVNHVDVNTLVVTFANAHAGKVNCKG